VYTNNDITRSFHTYLFLRSIPERCILEALLRRVLYCGYSTQYSHIVPIVDALDIARQSCAMVPRWRSIFFASCIFSEPRTARFRPAS